jgi:hypothetical protein
MDPATHNSASVVLTVSLPENAITESSRNVQRALNAEGSRFVHPETSRISVTVTASDMTSLTKYASVDEGETTVSIAIPDVFAGVDRTFDVSFYDNAGTLLAAGSTTADIVKNQANPVAVTPIPNNPIVLTPGVGSFYPIPAGSGGKTFVFIMSDFAPGLYDAFATACPLARVSVYDQNGRCVISGTASGCNSFATYTPCYLAVSIPRNFATASTFGYVPGYTVGDSGPGGGYIFYVAGNDIALSQGWKYLEVSPYSTQFDTNAAWSAGGDTVGAYGTGLGSGKANTDSFIALHTASGSYPAQLCYNLSYNGKSDWYCPSRDELELLRTSFYNDSLSSSDPRYFNSDSYWTSTEVDASNAITLSFGSGPYSSDKSSGRRTRAIRQFLY